MLAQWAFETGDKSANLTVDAISAEPAGSRVLLTAQVKGSTTGFFGNKAEGTIYLWAEPQLDEAAQTLRLANVSVDAQSSNALGLMASSILSLAASFIEGKIQSKTRFDLGPEAEKLKARAARAIGKLNTELTGQADFQASVDSLTLDRIAVTPNGIELIASAKGLLAIAIKNIDISQ